MSLKEVHPNYYDDLLQQMRVLYSQLVKGKTPTTLQKIAKELLIKMPNCFFFKVVEIKTFYSNPDDDLNQCFPGDTFRIENMKFKGDINQFLYQNIKYYADNKKIIEGIKKIIDNLKADSMIKQYINLIKNITNKMDEESGIKCELLVSTPYKYKELVYMFDTTLALSPLPKEASEFYALKNYKQNQIALKNFAVKNDPLLSLKSDFSKKINELNALISNLLGKIDSQDNVIKDLKSRTETLEKDSKITKDILFNIQIRDIISSVIDQFTWIFPVQKNDNFINELKSVLEGLEGEEKKASKIIINLLSKALEFKDKGNDYGHPVKNLGFNSMMLPKEIKENYEKYKTGSNHYIKDCDCLAMILSVKNINDSQDNLTKKIYKLINDILSLKAKDWENNKKEISSILLSFNE